MNEEQACFTKQFTGHRQTPASFVSFVSFISKEAHLEKCFFHLILFGSYAIQINCFHLGL